MGKRLATPRINKADVISINKILIDIYRNLNVIGNSADEVSYKEDKKGNKELVINDNGKEYVDNSKNASFGPNIHSLKTKIKKDLKKELLLNNVTNESKTTMLDNPPVTSSMTITGQPGVSSGQGRLFIQGDTAGSGSKWEIASSASAQALGFTDGNTNSSNWLSLVMSGTSFVHNNNTQIVQIANTSGIQGSVTFDAGDNDGSDDCFFFNNGKTVFEHNVTSSGTITSSNGVCSGPARHFIHTGFNYSYTAGTLIYVPINGYVIENSTSGGRNEFQTFVAPYDGYVNQVVFRSEEACGDTIVGLHKSATGTEIPNTTAVGTVTVDMAVDDTAYKFDFVNNLDGGGARTFDAGDILAISFDPTSDANDTVCTVELIFNTAEGL